MKIKWKKSAALALTDSANASDDKNAAMTVIVLDITGRTIATLAPGQSATLTPGHYLITTTPETTTATTHILIK